jgi:hypothetical protein
MTFQLLNHLLAITWKDNHYWRNVNKSNYKNIQCGLLFIVHVGLIRERDDGNRKKKVLKKKIRMQFYDMNKTNLFKWNKKTDTYHVCTTKSS